MKLPRLRKRARNITTASGLCHEAIRLIKYYGWTSGNWKDENDGCMCVEGAILAAADLIDPADPLAYGNWLSEIPGEAWDPDDLPPLVKEAWVATYDSLLTSYNEERGAPDPYREQSAWSDEGFGRTLNYLFSMNDSLRSMTWGRGNKPILKVLRNAARTLEAEGK